MVNHCNLGIVQVLGDEPWGLLKPELEMLLADQEKNKQRAAAELLAGVLNGEQAHSGKNSSCTDSCRF
jgi:proteasome activator subunit 4